MKEKEVGKQKAEEKGCRGLQKFDRKKPFQRQDPFEICRLLKKYAASARRDKRTAEGKGDRRRMRGEHRTARCHFDCAAYDPFRIGTEPKDGQGKQSEIGEHFPEAVKKRDRAADAKDGEDRLCHAVGGAGERSRFGRLKRRADRRGSAQGEQDPAQTDGGKMRKEKDDPCRRAFEQDAAHRSDEEDGAGGRAETGEPQSFAGRQRRGKFRREPCADGIAGQGGDGKNGGGSRRKAEDLLRGEEEASRKATRRIGEQRRKNEEGKEDGEHVDRPKRNSFADGFGVVRGSREEEDSGGGERETRQKGNQFFSQTHSSKYGDEE